MSHNNDNSEMLYFGGIVVIVIVVGFLIKILKAIMLELSLLFVAIGKAASAFIMMAWQIAQVLGLLSLGVAAIYAAWIFSKKYYQVVKDATDVKEQIENRFSDLHSEFTDSFKKLRRDAACEINQMRQELDEALKRTEVVPSTQQASAEGVSSQVSNETDVVAPEIVTTGEVGEVPSSADAQSTSEPIDQEKTQIQDAPKDISNPF